MMDSYFLPVAFQKIKMDHSKPRQSQHNDSMSHPLHGADLLLKSFVLLPTPEESVDAYRTAVFEIPYKSGKVVDILFSNREI